MKQRLFGSLVTGFAGLAGLLVGTFAQADVSFLEPAYTVSDIRTAPMPGNDRMSQYKFDLIHQGIVVTTVTQSYNHNQQSDSEIGLELIEGARTAVASFLKKFGVVNGAPNPLLTIEGMRIDRVFAREVKGIFTDLTQGKSLEQVKYELARRRQIGGENWESLEIYYAYPTETVMGYMRRGVELEKEVKALRAELDKCRGSVNP
ncbi:MAG: hypothetical protein AB7P04_07810 [Bacteriovoracia bacterium]